MYRNTESFSQRHVEEGWYTAQDLPLAVNSPENIITPDGVDAWLADLQMYARHYPRTGWVKEYSRNGVLDLGALRSKYETELRLLSATDAVQGLGEFAQEITTQFSPEDSLFYFPPESASAYLLYNTMVQMDQRIAQFGTTLDSRYGLKLSRQNYFQQREPSEAAAFIYVDDWVLSGNHMQEFLTTDVAGRFNTFHLAVSDAGANFLKAMAQYINPRFKYKVKSVGPEKMYAEVPLYGSHKIPDRVPEYYASNHEGYYSIFGRIDGYQIINGTRIIDHSGTFFGK